MSFSSTKMQSIKGPLAPGPCCLAGFQFCALGPLVPALSYGLVPPWSQFTRLHLGWFRQRLLERVSHQPSSGESQVAAQGTSRNTAIKESKGPWTLPPFWSSSFCSVFCSFVWVFSCPGARLVLLALALLESSYFCEADAPKIV